MASHGVIVRGFLRCAPAARHIEILDVVRTATFESENVLQNPFIAWAKFALAPMAPPHAEREYLGALLRCKSPSGYMLEGVGHAACSLSRASTVIPVSASITSEIASRTAANSRWPSVSQAIERGLNTTTLPL